MYNYFNRYDALTSIPAEQHDVPMNQIPVSCYIRTRNEAKRIGAVIKKVKEIGAEVIVIDDCSTDETREIAKHLGAIVTE